MKKPLLFCTLFFTLTAYAVLGQSSEGINNFLLMKGNNGLTASSPTGDPRTYLKLRNEATIPSSLVSIELSSGSGGASTSTFLSHHAKEYDYANGAFAGFGQIYSRDNGLILRSGSAQNPFGVIKFMTGNDLYGNFSLERMRIDAYGNVGIGVRNPKSKLQVTDGDVYVDNPSRGIILKSPSGFCWRVTVDDAGNLIRTQINCPE
ncbi:hypothetical protein [Runella sp.]|uniref:hypothetical protein n=1 Tax=Runella sp. TaxID=1960881 RepID=UPI003D0C5101